MTARPHFWWQDEDAVPDDGLARVEAEDARRAAFEDELDRAAKDIEAAHLRYDEAARRCRCAPHGEVAARREGLRLANENVLRAEVRFADLKRGELRRI